MAARPPPRAARDAQQRYSVPGSASTAIQRNDVGSTRRVDDILDNAV